MKRFKIALLATAFAVTPMLSLAQVAGSAGSDSAANIGVSTKLQTNTGDNGGGSRTKHTADASGNISLRKPTATTTGSGSAGAGVRAPVR